MLSGRSDSPSCAFPIYSLTLEQEKEGREVKRKGGTQKSLTLGSAPRRAGVEGSWRRPRWIRNPRVERTKPHLSHLEPWASSTLSLVPQSPGSNHTGRAARMVGNWGGPHSPHNPSRGPERQEKENRAFKEPPKWVVNSEPSSYDFNASYDTTRLGDTVVRVLPFQLKEGFIPSDWELTRSWKIQEDPKGPPQGLRLLILCLGTFWDSQRPSQGQGIYWHSQVARWAKLVGQMLGFRVYPSQHSCLARWPCYWHFSQKGIEQEPRGCVQ